MHGYSDANRPGLPAEPGARSIGAASVLLGVHLGPELFEIGQRLGRLFAKINLAAVGADPRAGRGYAARIAYVTQNAEQAQEHVVQVAHAWLAVIAGDVHVQALIRLLGDQFERLVPLKK